MFKPRKSDTTVSDENKMILDKYAWMVRPCTVYIKEYSDCTSMRGRFDQYYAEGEFADCSRWRSDRKDCHEYTKEGNFEAGVRIIKNERRRIEERLKSFEDNDVMKQRKIRPPPNWNRQLPFYIEEKHKDSHLSKHLEELSGPYDPVVPSSCVIS